jgi:hypothetical protein
MDSLYVKGKFERVLGGKGVKDDDVNYGLVKELETLINHHTTNGVKIHTIHVYGHGDTLGNNIADELATIGLNISREYKDEELRHSLTDKVVLNKYRPHPFIVNIKNILVVDDVYNQESMSLRVVRYKDQLDTGKPSSEALYGYIFLKKKDELLSILFDAYFKRIKTIKPSIVNVSTLYKPLVVDYIGSYGSVLINIEEIFSYGTRVSVGNEIVMHNLYPSGLAMRAYDSVDILSGIVTAADVDVVHKTDVTDLFYKDGAIVLPQGTKEVNLKVKVFKRLRKVKLTLGIDLLDRNSLKKLEKLEPRVTVAIKYTNANIASVYTIIELNDGSYSVWGNPFINKFVK